MVRSNIGPRDQRHENSRMPFLANNVRHVPSANMNANINLDKDTNWTFNEEYYEEYLKEKFQVESREA